jgi:hypothetical protein
MASNAVVCLLACLAACCMVLLTGRDVAATMFGCWVIMPDKAWVAMVLDMCILGVPLLVWWDPCQRGCVNVVLFLMGGMFYFVPIVLLFFVPCVWWSLFFVTFGHH